MVGISNGIAIFVQFSDPEVQPRDCRCNLFYFMTQLKFRFTCHVLINFCLIQRIVKILIVGWGICRDFFCASQNFYWYHSHIYLTFNKVKSIFEYCNKYLRIILNLVLLSPMNLYEKLTFQSLSLDRFGVFYPLIFDTSLNFTRIVPIVRIGSPLEKSTPSTLPEMSVVAVICALLAFRAVTAIE
jgi:hypothetical protein